MKRIKATGIQIEPLSNTISKEIIGHVTIFNLEITDEEFADCYEMIARSLESESQCNSCKGLSGCQSDAAGMKYILERGMTGKISPSYRICAFKETEVAVKRIERLLASSRLPEFFKDKVFSNFHCRENAEAFMAAQRVANEPESKGLFLYGPPGTGKTHLAAAIVNARLEKGMHAVFVTVPELMADIRCTIGRGHDTSRLLEIVKDVDLLVMDDMGAERLTDWVIEQLFDLINARSMRKKQTIVTSNYSPSELVARMAVRDRAGKIEDDLPGHRIVSRLSEMCQKVGMKGKDYRLGDFKGGA